MTGPARQPVHFTFGNHMHWADMQWLWGYDVLPGSVRDMLRLCREAGVKGNVNFDAVGYEKMAAECPEALAELREAVARGIVEPVGCSYGQPYGLFHGGESNIRQLTFGVRTTRRLLGVRPRAFWEEEFYFFPQLPQMLRQCGYTGACLFFQWTWHTPEVPREPHALILWEGIDGSRLPTLPRNELNLHQWPEDFAPLFESLSRESEHGPPARAIVQWVELMPSRDWMCRSEVLLPKLKELLASPGFEIVPGTLSEVIAALAGEGASHESSSPTREPRGSGADAPVRRYTMDEVWHGMTLGKNGDRHPRTSRACEHAILTAESLAATVSLLGRPYAQWDIYPTWELDEAWRELLAGQHHDNHECEGLCGSIGQEQFRRASRLAEDVLLRIADLLGRRIPGDGQKIAFNRSGWPQRYPHVDLQASKFVRRLTDCVPPLGFALPHAGVTRPLPKARCSRLNKTTIRLARESFQVDIDTRRGLIIQICSAAFPDGLLSSEEPLLRFERRVDGMVDRFQAAKVEIEADSMKLGTQTVGVTRYSDLIPDEYLSITISLDDVVDAVVLRLSDETDCPDRAFIGALRTPIALVFEHRLQADTPDAVDFIHPRGTFQRKYPKGDWMTSPQWFETIERPFTAQHVVAFRDVAEGATRGVAYIHDGAQQFIRTERGAEQILKVYDPWDEDRFTDSWNGMQMLLWPFDHATPADLRRLAHEHNLSPHNQWHRVNALHEAETVQSPDADIPPVFGPLSVEGAPSVLATALHRESMKSGEHFPDWVGHEMARRSGGACTHPFVIRLVEYDGVEAEVTLKLVGAVACAAKTNLMGEIPSATGSVEGRGVDDARDFHWLAVTPADPPDWAIDPKTGKCYEFRGRPLEWSQVRFRMRPREIATVYADMVMGRKEYRDLDAKREVWATVHRETEQGSRHRGPA